MQLGCAVKPSCAMPEGPEHPAAAARLHAPTEACLDTERSAVRTPTVTQQPQGGGVRGRVPMN